MIGALTNEEIYENNSGDFINGSAVAFLCTNSWRIECSRRSMSARSVDMGNITMATYEKMYVVLYAF